LVSNLIPQAPDSGAIMLIDVRDPQDIVGLFAGEDKGEKPLNIHKDVACWYSQVFKAAFNSRFKEGETQQYTLSDAARRTVRLLIHVSRAVLLKTAFIN
jgi:hypothetical protein